MNRFMAFAASALALTALLGVSQPVFADSLLELRGPDPSTELNPTDTPEFTLDLYYTPDAASIRTTVISTYLLYDTSKFTVAFNSTIDLAPGANNGSGRPTVAQRNALAPTRGSVTGGGISVLKVGGGRQLSSFNTPVDILGANPSGLVTTLALFDGDYNKPSSDPLAAIPGLIFPKTAGGAFTAPGFLVGRYTVSAIPDVNGNYAGTYGDTVIGFSDSLTVAGQNLSGEERARVETTADPNPAVAFGSNTVRRFTVVPAPSSVAIMAMGGLMPMFALARRRRAAK